MKTYQELKKENADELNKFEGLFFAFDNAQFKEGMEKIGITEKDTSLICSIGLGGYILKTQSQALSDMFKRHRQALKELKKNEKELIVAIAYELNNHEYGYTGEVEPALEALGLSKDDINSNVLKKAIELTHKEV